MSMTGGSVTGFWQKLARAALNSSRTSLTPITPWVRESRRVSEGEELTYEGSDPQQFFRTDAEMGTSLSFRSRPGDREGE